MEARARKKRRSAGFTLVEIMLAVFVLALTGLVFAATVPTSQISRIKAAHTTYAINLAKQTIEEKRSAGYASLVPGTDEVSVPADLPGGSQRTLITQTPWANVKKVEVIITWSGYRKVGGTITLNTLISDHS
ncbi:MAG TPA: prepilin-type N-terminal cleavage/methylation domain-containing protein [Armatimonadota bacterium]|nr:prepilin-type N-terminal cleavage/methylation domain-containing protein [Armatimonadota bacterium]